MQIRPPLPSLIILESVSCSFCLASSGILSSFVCSPSFTSSFKDLPNMLLCHILVGSSSNSLSRYLTSSSDCFSVPTTGLTSVSISARIRCIVRYKLRFLINSYFMMCILPHFSTNCKAFLHSIKLWQYTKLLKAKKIKGYRECAKQSFSIPLIVIPSDNIIHN